MLLKKIILRNRDKFELAIEEWSNRLKINVEIFDGKESLSDTVDALVILHEDHNISRENKDLRELLERNHKPTHQVDINATVSASVSSLKFWLENNKPTNVMWVGDEKLSKSSRLQDYLDKLATRIN